MESANDHVLEAVALNLCPVFNLVAGNVFGVARHVVAGEGICAFCTDGSHQLVVFVRDEIFCGNLRYRVNLVIFLLAKFWVLNEPVFLVAAGNLVEKWLFRFGIVGAELFRAFKHQVLKIVGQACCLGGIIL